MFGHVYKWLTEASNHYVDWSRVGELLASSTHRYSRDELKVRGGIAACAVASGLVGAYLNDEEKTHYADLTLAMASGLLGFVVSHVVVIYPLIKKRIDMRNTCVALVEKIGRQVEDLDVDVRELCRASVNEVIQSIDTLSLSNDKRANASLTWGARKTLFRRLSDKLAEEDYDARFWQQSPANIMAKLSANNTTMPPPRLR